MMQKGIQTPEEVVETAMKAIKSGKSQAISGWLNYFIARSVNIIPDSLITRAVGGQLRPKFQEKKD
jgi:short-subunit dehydrogenase